MSKQIHYNIDNIRSKDAEFNIIFGEKSNGKSYQVKHKIGILHYLETGKRFILFRRWDADVTSLWIEQYFNDVDVASLTNNKYQLISNYRKVLYLSNLSEDGKIIRGEKIGYVMALSTEQHYSSGSFLDVDMMIFEEFMERGSYIKNEPEKLMFFYSTIDRKRGTTKMWMVGNTISRVNPYLHSWNLQNTVRNMKQGDIEVIEIPTDDEPIKLALEYCRSSGGKITTFGSASSSIEGGAWQAEYQPKLPKSYNEYKVLYRFGFQYQSFKFLCEYLVDKENPDIKIWFIKPKYNEFKKDTIIFTDQVKPSPYYQRNIYSPDFNNKKLIALFQTFTENKIFYSDDLTGTDFKTAIDFSIRK